MTDYAIQEQIRTIKKASDKATKSKASALQFLAAAGLVKVSTLKPQPKAKK